MNNACGIEALMQYRDRLLDDVFDDEASAEHYQKLVWGATTRAKSARKRIADIDGTIQQLREQE